MDINSLQDLRVVDLKKELDSRGLPKSGSKKELIDRLRNFIENEGKLDRSSDANADEHAPSLELQEAGDNEFVKNYLQQRQQLLSQQMEQRKRYEEEASRSHSECETDEMESSPEKQQPASIVESAAPHQEDSGDSTDIEAPPEADDKQTEKVAQKTDVSHDGDGDKSDVAETDKLNSTGSAPAASHDESRSSVTDEDSSVAVSAARELQKQSASRSRSRSADSRSSRSESDDRRHSRSKSRGSDRSAADRRGSRSASSRSNSKSSSRSATPERKKPSAVRRVVTVVRSRSSSRSSSEDERKSPAGNRQSRSRSSSPPAADTRIVKERSRSASEEEGEVTSTPDRRAVGTRSRSRSSSVEKTPMPMSEVSQGEESMNADVAPAPCQESVQPVELIVEESQQSMDIKLEVDKKVNEVTQSACTVESSTAKTVGTDNAPSSLPAMESEPDISFTAAKPIRKRKWGSSAVKHIKTIDISTDSLKSIGLEISAEALSAETPMEISDLPPPEVTKLEITTPSPASAQRTVLKTQDSTSSESKAPKIRRIIYKDPDEDKKPVVEEKVSKVVEAASDTNGIQLSANDDVKAASPGEPAKITRAVSLTVNDQAKVARSVSLTVEDPIDVGRRAPSPPRHPPSKVIHVTGLVRPYTLGQLKELLGRTGTLVPDGFWIDNIKSHCYVTYETVEQAIATREALHGKRWPTTNPKILGVEFRTADEVEFRKSNKVVSPGAVPGPAKPFSAQLSAPAEIKKELDKPRLMREIVQDVAKDAAKSTRDRDTTRSRPKETKENTAPAAVREWDRHKLRQSRSKSRERRPRDERPRSDRDRKEPEGRTRSRDDKKPRDRTDKPAGAKVEEEPPAKLLDDLFRKTKAIPCIYWLPLTDEQVAEKMAEEKERQARKEKVRLEREQQLEAERQERIKARDERERARDADRNARRKFSEEPRRSRSQRN